MSCCDKRKILNEVHQRRRTVATFLAGLLTFWDIRGRWLRGSRGWRRDTWSAYHLCHHVGLCTLCFTLLDAGISNTLHQAST